MTDVPASSLVTLDRGPPPPRVIRVALRRDPPLPWRRRAPPSPASPRHRLGPVDRNVVLLSPQPNCEPRAPISSRTAHPGPRIPKFSELPRRSAHGPDLSA